jgi:hypothetical protein
MEPLGVVNAELSKSVKAVLVLDALTDGLETQACGEADDGLNDVATR